MSNAKELVHELYNTISNSSNSTNLDDIQEVLLKTYKKLDKVKDDAPLIDRLVKYIYFKAATEPLHFSDEQSKLISELALIGGKAGLNAAYRSDYGDKSQFD